MDAFCASLPPKMALQEMIFFEYTVGPKVPGSGLTVILGPIAR